jgi:heme A synthase
MRIARFAEYSWIVLAYNLAVILWGAYVRATGSGAGCGSHWPLCNGLVIPRAAQVETLIEFTHRLSSGISLILVVGMLVWALRAYPKSHQVRLGAWLSMTFIFTEALVGAGLVLFKWVAQDASVGRAISMAVHLLNTFLLLASLALTAWWASGGRSVQFKGKRVALWGLTLALLGVLILGVSGALNALGDTLFPAASLAEGIQQDFSPTAHFLIRLRLLHPTFAVMTGIYVILFSSLVSSGSPDSATRHLSRGLILLVLMQLGAGLLNVALLAPVWMQLVHLFLADAVWIVLVFLAASILSQQEGGVEEQRFYAIIPPYGTQRRDRTTPPAA